MNLHGVKTRVGVRDAKAICPGIKIVQGFPPKQDLPVVFGPLIGPDQHPRYELVSIIGSGAQGTVYMAKDRKFNDAITPSLVAIKLCVHKLSSDRESTRARAVEHSNVARVLDRDTHERVSYIVYELIKGEPMSEWLDLSRTLPWRKACRMMIDLCSGVEAAHGAGVIHRDIKPSNVMITQEGTPVLTDFGVSSFEMIDAHNEHTEGSLLFMSPEQHERASNCGQVSDIYALAGVLFWLLTGDEPNGSSPELAEQRLRNNDPADISSLRLRRIPDRLIQVIEKAMHPDARRRTQSASLLSSEIIAVLENQPIRWMDSDTVAAALFLRRHALAGSLAIVGTWFLISSTNSKIRMEAVKNELSHHVASILARSIDLHQESLNYLVKTTVL